MERWVRIAGLVVLAVVLVAFLVSLKLNQMRKAKRYERSLKMVPMLIHLPPPTDDVQVGSRDERDVLNEELSKAQAMYTIIASTMTKGYKTKLYGQRHLAFEMVAKDGLVKYYVVSPAVMIETVKQAVLSAYPTAQLETMEEENIFSKEGKIDVVAGGELTLKKDYCYPISTYEEVQRDATLGLLNAMSTTKEGEGLVLQILVRPAHEKWIQKSLRHVQKIKDGKKKTKGGNTALDSFFLYLRDVTEALWKPPETHESEKIEEAEALTGLESEEIGVIEGKTKHPGYETLIRVIASAETKARSEAMVGGVVSAFAQFDSQRYNGFRYNILKRPEKLATDVIFRFFPKQRTSDILNSVELATIFHLPSQTVIPTGQVERQMTKQVDGPANLVTEGLLLGVNEFRGAQKEIRLSQKDRRRHTYVIGATGMGKSTLLGNLAYQDMMDGRGFAFVDPHGDIVEDILSKVPPERIDDVIYFDPGDMENPIGMNMFEFESPDQKDFIIQEGINMLYSLYDPGHTGIFGPRGEHMFRNAALLLMADPNGATFVDIPRAFIDPEFVKAKLQYVTDRTVYDYWTKEFPASQRSTDAGEVTTWFISKWGPFLSNTMMRNILGQVKSGFDFREIMDEQKILLVNLSKGKMGELNSKLLGMIFVMKFQTAAMSRVNVPEEERKDFCLFVDEFQNFSTDSFESILSEARKFRLNLIVANQFITQLTDRIREGILGNVGTFISGRLGVTDAELLEKVFAPVFNAEDLHKLPNYHAITTVMMNDVPTTPFTIRLLPSMGDKNPEVLASLKNYTAVKYGRPRAEVDAEINKRLAPVMKKEEELELAEAIANDKAIRKAPTVSPQEEFLATWDKKKQEVRAGAQKSTEGLERPAGGIEAVEEVQPVVEEPQAVMEEPQAVMEEPRIQETEQNPPEVSVKLR